MKLMRNNMNLSDNFTLQEFVVSRTALIKGISNQPQQQHIMPMMELCEALLEPIRKHFGPVTIHSGYRSHDLNIAVGGSDKSQHSKGEAADIVVGSKTPLEVCRWIEKSDLPFDQLIFEGAWTHISYGSRMRHSVLTAHFHKGSKTTYTGGLSDV